MAYPDWYFCKKEDIPNDFIEHFQFRKTSRTSNSESYLGYCVPNKEMVLHEFLFNDTDLAYYGNQEEIQFFSFDEFRLKIFAKEILGI